MEDFQQRVVTEKEELDDKISKLSTFLTGEVFSALDEEEQERLERQYSIMNEYSDVLAERIEEF